MAVIPVLCNISWYLFYSIFIKSEASQVALVVKNPPANAGDIRDQTSIPGSGRSPGEGNGNPLQYSCLENPMAQSSLVATVHGLERSWTWLKHLSMHTHTHSSFYLLIHLFCPSLLSNHEFVLYICESLSVLFYSFGCFIFLFIFISWRLITLQYCSGFCHTLTWISHVFTCISPSQSPLPPPSPPNPSGSSQCTRPKHLSHASNLGWWSVSP